MQIDIVDANLVRPSTYNPRKADRERLDLVALSLKKFGWLLPIYADANGEILSGHQRHYVATTMLGAKKVPVSYTKPMNISERKAINIAFNRGTNDMEAHETSANLTDAISASNIYTLTENLPDIDLDTDAAFRVLNVKYEPITPILHANAGRHTRHGKNISRTLLTKGITMPVIVDPDNRVINGVGRLEMLAAKGNKTIPVLRVRGDEAAAAEILLNLLTMDFDIHTKYADFLRHNSFRRSRLTRDKLGRGFTVALAKNADIDLDNPQHRDAWVKYYGNTVIDFGAGHLHETGILRDAGVRVSPFEPYHTVKNQIDIPKSKQLTQAFLQDVKSGVEWDSIFISSVLNSVPFIKDREAIATIAAALSTTKTKVHCYTIHTSKIQYLEATGQAVNTNASTRKLGQFVLDYEPGVIIGELNGKPKVQKFHTENELYNLFAKYFHDVRVHLAGSNCVIAIASNPKPIDAKELAAAIRFEFDLPYPDGTRHGMGEAAIDAFAARLNLPELQL